MEHPCCIVRSAHRGLYGRCCSSGGTERGGGDQDKVETLYHSQPPLFIFAYLVLKIEKEIKQHIPK